MPTWLILLCALAVLVTAIYLVYVIFRPDDF